MAASSIANIVKSSLGPVGLDKMLVDDIGVRFVTFFIITTKFHKNYQDIFTRLQL